MSSISILNTAVTDLQADAVVRTPDQRPIRGDGFPPSVFQGAGLRRLEFICDSAAPGDTCFAVIAPGVHQKAKYIIHVVGPRHLGLIQRESPLLRSIYLAALTLAQRNGCHSVGFPLLSAGIFKFPLEAAWRTALRSCCDFFHENPCADLDVIFASTDERSLEEGHRQLSRLDHEVLHGSSALSLTFRANTRMGDDGRLIVGA